MIYSYKAYVEELIKAAEYFEKEHTDFPDVIATYKNSARIIKTLSVQLDAATAELKECASKLDSCNGCLYQNTKEIHELGYIPCGNCGPYYRGGWEWNGYKAALEKIKNDEEKHGDSNENRNS